MKTILKKTLEWSADKLSGIAAAIEREDDAVEAPSKFVDLAPTDQADKSGVYSEALEYALSRPKVSNIALTGPYGSGKSSIIQTFLKKYNRKALHISLAAFLPEAGSQIEKVKGGGDCADPRAGGPATSQAFSGSGQAPHRERRASPIAGFATQ